MIRELLYKLYSSPLGAYLGNSYLQALVIVIFFVVLAKLIKMLFSKYLHNLAKKTKSKLDDLIVEKISSPLFFLVMVYGFKVGVIIIAIDGWVNDLVSSAMAVVFVFIISRIIDIFILISGKAFAKKTDTDVDKVLFPLLIKIFKVIMVIVAIFWVLNIWKVDLTPYLAGVGISGIVLGLALQDSIKNMLGGITLILDKTYQVGDKIKLESGDVGTIMDVGLRSTKMITFDHEVIYVPNGYLANSRVKNYTRPDPRVRVKVDFGVEYGSDAEKVRKTVIKIISKMEGVLDDPAPEVYFLSMGDFSLHFRSIFWVSEWDKEFWKKIEATEKIYNGLRKAKIKIPFPTQTIYLKK